MMSREIKIMNVIVGDGQFFPEGGLSGGTKITSEYHLGGHFVGGQSTL